MARALPLRYVTSSLRAIGNRGIAISPVEIPLHCKTRIPNPDFPGSCATSPRSDVQRDFVNLSCEPWPLILLLEDFFLFKASSGSNLLLSPSSQNHEGTILPELVNSDSLRYFAHSSHAQLPTDPKVLSLPDSVHLWKQQSRSPLT
jgi:hypothetical protein